MQRPNARAPRLKGRFVPRRRGLRPHLLAAVVPSRRPYGVLNGRIVSADILAIEKEAEGLLDGLLKTGKCR